MPLSLAVVSKRQIRTFQIPALVNEFTDTTEYYVSETPTTLYVLVKSFTITVRKARRVQVDSKITTSGATGYVQVRYYDGSSETTVSQFNVTSTTYSTFKTPSFICASGEIRVYAYRGGSTGIYVTNIKVDNPGYASVVKVGAVKNTCICYPNVDVEFIDDDGVTKYIASGNPIAANSRGIVDFNYMLRIAGASSGSIRVIQVPEGFAS